MKYLIPLLGACLLALSSCRHMQRDYEVATPMADLR